MDETAVAGLRKNGCEVEFIEPHDAGCKSTQNIAAKVAVRCAM